MRLIGEFQNEKEAFEFQTFLQNHGIQSVYDTTPDSTYRLWVIEEDDFDKTLGYYQEWQHDPTSPSFHFSQPPNADSEHAVSVSHPEHTRWRVRMSHPPLHTPFSLNNFIILICGFLFIWTLFQMSQLEKERGSVALKYELVPLQKELMFDYPADRAQIEKFLDQNDIRTEEDLKALPPKVQARFQQIERTPTWKGVVDMFVTRDWTLVEKLPEGTLFGKIRQGEIWRLITPVLLHGGFLHILLNMAWLFVLGRQIEACIGKIRYLFLSLILGIVGNVAQYLMTGPMFLGYSGIIIGMVGFIWMRQKVAPWEGYPLQRPVILFITVFVAAVFALEILSIALQFFHIQALFTNIANTAHVAGGIFGVLLGRLSLFERGQP